MPLMAMAKPTSQETQYCFRCGAQLILIRRTVDKNSSQSPVTSTTYKCSDKQCQAAHDKKMAELAQKRKEQEANEIAKALAAAEKKQKAKEEKEAAALLTAEEPSDEDLVGEG